MNGRESANKTFRVGDRVRWESRGVTAEGRVVEIAFESGRIGDFVYDASRESPRYIVETDEGRKAAPRAEALRHLQPGLDEGRLLRSVSDARR